MAEAPRGDRRELAFRLFVGELVIAALFVLDGVEYYVATHSGQTTLWMALLAIPQAWLIVRFYMHGRQLRRGGEDG
jgi:cytochrome c oxidase subunit IV